MSCSAFADRTHVPHHLDQKPFEDLCHGLHALKNINLDIRAGEIFALLGPNGAGKTTLIGTICGLVGASEGTVTVGGHDITRDYRAARSMIGLVPQELHTDAGKAPGPPPRSAGDCSASRRIPLISRRC
jgi:ABC-type molybdenum transport system ATPase subunit/photorepair protein PhrA